MSSTILIIGGSGLIGKTIHSMLSNRNPSLKILIGTRKKDAGSNNVQVDVNDQKSFESLKGRPVDLIVLCTRDSQNNVLGYAQRNRIDYIDITKPSSELFKAHDFIKKSTVQSRIVFSSGWMGGIAPLLLYSKGMSPVDLRSIKIAVYYSTKDKAGSSSADFMAENVSRPFPFYRNNAAVKTRHYLNEENYVFKFDNKKRKISDFDIPDLYIFNQIEKIPSVAAKLTFDSQLITSALNVMQKIHFFKILSFREKKWIFGGSGKGDISSFEIIYFGSNSKEGKIGLQSKNGQSELTAFSTVLHIEKMMEKTAANGIYFSHQLHDPKEFMVNLMSDSSISLV